MKVLVAVLCLYALVAMILAQEDKPNVLVATCSQVCTQTCDVFQQMMSLFQAFLGPLVDTMDQMCHQGCGMVCGFLG